MGHASVTSLGRSLGRPRHGRSAVAVLAYLVAFAVGLALLSHFYLLPAMRVAQTASPDDRRRLGAQALLVLIVVLFVLGAGLVLTFRVSRFFFPRPTAPRRKTEYVDAWAESARRMETPPREDDPGT